MIDDLYLYSCANWTQWKPIEEQAPGPSPLATFPPQADHVLVDLFSSMADRGGPEGGAPPQFYLL